jgi:fructose-bisphosphate aldolase, class II
MQPLREVLGEYKSRGKALAHFNFSDSTQLRAIALAAKETGIPVIAGLSEGEREFFPFSHAVPLVAAYQAEGVPLYLNADHTYSTEKVQRAISAGVDSVVVDGAKLPYDQNKELLVACVKYARASGRDVLVEGELGFIGTSSAVMEALPEGAQVSEAQMTTPEELKKLVEETGIDAVAPAVGNVHGMVKSGQPKLSPERVAALAAAVPVPLVLHGGSGSPDEEFVAVIKAGISLIHINTELRVLYRDSLREALKGDETTPYKFLTPPLESMKQYIAQKMRLFANA